MRVLPLFLAAMPLLTLAAEPKIEIHENLAYREGNSAWTLDLYVPAGAGVKRPASVLFHGGGWRTGAKRTMGGEARRLAARGYVAAAVEYRVVKAGVLLADCIQDVKNSVRWLRANAEKYGVD